MSEDNYRFNFSNGFQRSTQQQQQQHQLRQQEIRQEKLRVQQSGFEAQLTGMEDDQEQESEGGLNRNNNPQVYHETAGGMLSEMFNFPQGSSAHHHHHHLMEHQNYHRAAQPPVTSMEWSSYGGPLLQINNDSKNIHQHHHHHGSNINVDSAAAAAMQLFLMNPSSSSSSQHPRSPPSPVTPPLHMLLPNPSPSNSTLNIQGFHNPHLGIHNNSNNNTVFHQPAAQPPPPHDHQFGRSYGDQDQIGGFIDAAAGSQHEGLSLSLSSSLQHLEAAKAEELRIGDAAGMLFFNQGHPGVGQSSSTSTHHQHNYPYSRNNHLQQNQQPIVGHQVGYGSSIGVVNVMRNSKYVKAAQELLEEFCSVGRGQFKKINKFGARNSNPTTNTNNPGHVGDGGASSSNKDVPPLSASDRIEHQRRKVKLLSMHDEVDRRYNHYCEQMQMVVNSFDLVMGFGSAVPYTALAQKAMSRHFRCLKDAISAQLKHSYEILGEKDGAGSSGVTKGETPRLRMLEQSLRQQRAFHQMGMMEQEAWRPQRGLPERSVGILRAWLFEHFLHPYPNDADKHLLARQTGLSRNQVSNWFINARVRLWKPMVEEMYVQESKEDEDNEEQEHDNNNMDQKSQSQSQSSQSGHAQTTITAAAGTESDLSSLITMNRHNNNNISSAENHAKLLGSTHDNQYHSHRLAIDDTTFSRANGINITAADHYGTTSSAAANIGIGPAQLISRGDVSLTLGLRHSGNITPDHDSFFGL